MPEPNELPSATVPDQPEAKPPVRKGLWSSTAIYEAFRSRLVIAIDPSVRCGTRDSVCTAQVCYGHLLFLITG